MYMQYKELFFMQSDVVTSSTTFLLESICYVIFSDLFGIALLVLL